MEFHIYVNRCVNNVAIVPPSFVLNDCEVFWGHKCDMCIFPASIPWYDVNWKIVGVSTGIAVLGMPGLLNGDGRINVFVL